MKGARCHVLVQRRKVRIYGDYEIKQRASSQCHFELDFKSNNFFWIIDTDERD